MIETKTPSSWQAGIIASLWVTLAGLLFFGVFVLMLTQWTSTPDLLRRSVITWHFASGSSVHIEGISVGFIPLGLIAIKGLIVYLSAGFSIRKYEVDPRIFIPVTAASSAFIAALLSVIASTEALSVPLFRTAFMAFIVAAVGSAVAVYHRNGQVWFGMPLRWWPVAEGASGILMLFFGISTLILLIRLTLTMEEAANMWATLYPQGQGAILGILLLLGLPTVVVCIAAVLLGTPVSLGEDAYVNLAATQMERLPILPILSAVPEPGPHPTWVMALGLVPILCGVFGGILLRYRISAEVEWKTVLTDAAVAGVAAGVVAGIFIATAAGGFGTGVLQSAGTAPLLATPIAVFAFTLGALLGASAAHYRLTRVRF